MELEVKVPLTDADEAVESITKYLEEQGVALCEPQEGKTMRLFRSMGYIDDEGGEL